MTMRKFSKHTPEQIVVKLEKAEALRGEGMSTAQACRVLGISEATLCRRIQTRTTPSIMRSQKTGSSELSVGEWVLVGG